MMAKKTITVYECDRCERQVSPEVAQIEQWQIKPQVLCNLCKQYYQEPKVYEFTGKPPKVLWEGE